MPIRPELEFLTTGYEPVAQMSISLAHDIGYINHVDYVIVNARGDDTSAGLPYFADVTYSDDKGYQFSTYDTSRILTVSPDYQILVYHKSPAIFFSVDEQIDMLEEFAIQFDVDSFIRQFLSYHLMQWLRRNKGNPDIHTELVHMKNVAHRLEDNIIRLNNLFNDPFPY